jgi:osmoprotectant transport system permease protein
VNEGPLVRWDWVWSHLDDIWELTVQHVVLTVIAVSLGLVIAGPLAYYGYRHYAARGPITWVAGVLYTIPSLALFAFLVPFTGLSILTAEIGLVGYTLLILFRNIVAGLDAVPDEVIEAAAGMGYTDRRRFWEVELPLAMPVIIAGIRIATVTTVGLVTVTSLISYGGYGKFILQGLNRFFNTQIIIGAVLSVLLATVADVLLIRLERRVTPWAQRRSE